jgi:hypothetical protein
MRRIYSPQKILKSYCESFNFVIDNGVEFMWGSFEYGPQNKQPAKAAKNEISTFKVLDIGPFTVWDQQA